MKVILTVVVLLGMLLLTLLALPFLVDLNPYVERYKPQIEAALQRKLLLSDIRLTIWPRLGARVSGFVIMDDPAFADGPFASFSSLDIGVKLWPLLTGRLDVEEISLRDPVIAVIKNKQGILNVSTIGAVGAGQPTTGPRPAPTAPEGGPLRALGLLAVDHVLLTNGQLTFRDLSTIPKPTEYVLQSLEVRLANLYLGATPLISMRTVVQPYNLPVTLDGQAGPLKESGELDHLDVKLGVGKTLVVLEGSLAGGQAKLLLTSPAIDTADLPLALPLTKPILIKNLRTQVEAPYPLPAGQSAIELLTAQPMELDVAMGESVVTLKGSIRGRRVKVLLTSSSLKSTDLPLTWPLEKPVTIRGLKVQAEAPFPPASGTPVLDHLTVQPMELVAVMGSSTVTVKGSAVGGELRVQATSPALNTGDLPVPIAALKKSVAVTNVRLTMQAKGNQAHITDLAFQLFGGQVKGGAGATLNATPLPFDAKLVVNGLQLGPLVEAVGTDKVRISGTTTANVTLRGLGYSMPELTRSLEGAGHLEVKDGTLEGVDLTRETLTLLKVFGVSPDAAQTTVFSGIETDWSIKQGLVILQRMLVDSRDFQATAQGTVGFDQHLDLKANLALSQALSQRVAGSSSIARLASSGGRLSVPLLIGGTMPSPTYALDLKALGGKAQEQFKEKVRENVQEQAEKLLRGRAGEDIQKGADALKRLFGR